MLVVSSVALKMAGTDLFFARCCFLEKFSLIPAGFNILLRALLKVTKTDLV